MKNKRKGISLIVLVITIIVVIILASAVILNITKNNPMDSAKVAKLVQEREAVEQSILLYMNAKMASTNGDYTTTEILSGVSGNDSLKGVIADEPTAVTVYDAANAQITGSLYAIDSTKSKSELDLTLPSNSGATWLVDVNSGKVYLQYADVATAPAYMKDNGEIVNTTLLQFLAFTSKTAATPAE